MICSPARSRACASVVLVVTLIGITCSQAQASAISPLGRATFYGAGDGFTLNDGSCACHKQDSESSWLNSRCESGFCFDYIGEARRHSTPALCQHYLPPQVKCKFAHWLAWGFWHVILKPVRWPTKLGLQCKLQALIQYAQAAEDDSLSCSAS